MGRKGMCNVEDKHYHKQPRRLKGRNEAKELGRMYLNMYKENRKDRHAHSEGERVV